MWQYHNTVLFKFRCNIFIGVRIIKEMPDLVVSRTHCRSEMFRSGPETHLTFRTKGVGCLSLGVTLNTHSLLAPKVKKGHRCTYIHPRAFTACYRVEFAVTQILHFFIFQRLRYIWFHAAFSNLALLSSSHDGHRLVL